MQKLFFDTRELDRAAQEKLGLSQDILMENAAAALETEVQKTVATFFSLLKAPLLKTNVRPPYVLILTGSGNNGADGYALSRRLCGSAVGVVVCVVLSPKTPLCHTQCERAHKTGVQMISCEDCAPFVEKNGVPLVTVDCVFGSGFHGELSQSIRALFSLVASWGSHTISCDVPSGLTAGGRLERGAFLSDVTVSMGALTYSLFSDAAKDACPTIVCAPLGVSRAVFESFKKEDVLLLEPCDLRLPVRKKQNAHKGSFGHVAIMCGTKPGAAILAGKAALCFGAGLVTIVEGGAKISSAGTCPELMFSAEIPQRTSAIALGMGLGDTAAPYIDWIFSHPEVPCVLDADVLYHTACAALLQERSARHAQTVVTPHPKEFAALLSVCSLGEYDVPTVLKEKISLARAFCQKYEDVVLLLKGASTIIAQKPAGKDVLLYVNPLGTVALSKAGSGDVLSGLLVALLAQQYSSRDAAISASVAHALAGKRIEPTFSLTPQKLIDSVCTLEMAL